MWLRLGVTVITLLPKLIGLVEKAKGSGSGAEKRATVKDIILTAVEATEGVVGRDLLNDPDVAKAYDAANDALVALQNVLVKKASTLPAPAPAPVP